MSEFEAVGQALPAKAQRVGGKSESSTSRRSYEKEAIAAKNRAIYARVPDAKHGLDARSRQSAMMPRSAASVEWRRTSAE
jgi:phage gp16-like protein